MIQRGIGVTIGGLVTLVLLLILVPANPAWQDYIAPLVIGNVAAFFWPVVIAFWLGRRAKQRRDSKIEDEVQRQLDQERNGWFHWSGDAWEEHAAPVITHPHFDGTGTRFLEDSGRQAIEGLFERSFR